MTTKKNSKAKTSSKAKASEPAEPRKLGALDAAHQILASATEPMSCKELIEAMTQKGLWTSPGGKTPQATLSAALGKEIVTKGKESRFKKTGPGRFAAA
jgi:hypothetical protein